MLWMRKSATLPLLNMRTASQGRGPGVGLIVSMLKACTLKDSGIEQKKRTFLTVQPLVRVLFTSPTSLHNPSIDRNLAKHTPTCHRKVRSECVLVCVHLFHGQDEDQFWIFWAPLV